MNTTTLVKNVLQVLGLLALISLVAYGLVKFFSEGFTGLYEKEPYTAPETLVDTIKESVEEQNASLTEGTSVIPPPLKEQEMSYPAVYKNAKVEKGLVMDSFEYEMEEPKPVKSLKEFDE